MKKILVIEDDLMVRTVIMDILEAEDFQVFGAEDGRLGGEMAREILPNLIICDVMMPEMDGYEVLRVLREDSLTQTIPFIFLTAKSTKADQRQGMEEGADDYLTKPFTRSELLGAIDIRLKKQQVVEEKYQSQFDELRNNLTLSLPHELRTPLNGIIASSELLIDDFSEMSAAEVQETLQDINLSAHRLYRLIQNFLLYADLQLIARDPERKSLLQKGVVESPKSTIIQVAEKVANKSQYMRRSDLFFNLVDVPVKITANALQKLVEELVDNAFKFSEVGTPVEIISQDLGDRYLIEFKDNGRGMTAAQIANIGGYQQFDRKVYEQQGSGLGLAIVKGLVNLHQGEFIIESRVKEQTTVQVFLWKNKE